MKFRLNASLDLCIVSFQSVDFVCNLIKMTLIQSSKWSAHFPLHRKIDFSHINYIKANPEPNQRHTAEACHLHDTSFHFQR